MSEIMVEAEQTDPKTTCGFCAIIGAPNAGKSTLVNELAGSKVSIVSHKVQTTRARLRAIYIDGNAQVILVDTPGIFSPRRLLDRTMVANAWGGANEANITVLLIDAKIGLNDEAKAIIATLQKTAQATVLVLNKIDLLRPETLLELSQRFNEAYAFKETFMVSAKTGSGVAKLRHKLAEYMPESPWLYPEDQVADVELRFMAAEITREKIYERLHQELPYASTVETESWVDQPDGSVKINQVVFVQRDSQKAIVLGKGGQMISYIGKTAREEMEKIFERRVHLFLFIKVRENWTEDPERLRMMGLDL